MTPQEENDEALRRATEEQRILTEANKAAAVATDKAREANVKIENATTAVMGAFQKLLDVQLRYQVAMAKGAKGSALFNDGVDAMTDSMQMAATALSLLVPGGLLVKGVVAGLTFMATNAMKSAAAMQKAANEQGDALNKAYQNLSKSGATASDGMTGLFKDVQKMRLNVHQLDAMSSVIANSAKEMTAMGGTTYKARKELANLVAATKPFELGLLNLGMSYDDQVEATAGYMKLQANLSQGQQRDYGKLSGGLKKYLEETEALTKVTGMNRKEQEAAQEKYLAQQRFGAKIQQLMDEGKKEEAELLQSQMRKYAAKGEQFAQAFADMTTGMITSDAAMKGNMSTQGKMMEEANAITEGRIKTDQEANASFQETMVAVKDTTKSFNALYQAGVGEDFLLPFKEAADITKAANQNFAQQINEAAGEVRKLINTTDDVDQQLKRYNKMIIDQNNRMLATQEKLNDKFMDTGVGAGSMLDRIVEAAQPLINFMMKLVDVFTPLAEGVGVAAIETLNLFVKLLQGDVIGAFESGTKAWNAMIEGVAATSEKAADSIWDSITSFGEQLLKSVEFITGPLGPVFDKVKQDISDLWEKFSTELLEIGKKMTSWATDTWESVKQGAAKFGSDMLASVEKITGPLGPVFDKVKTSILGLGDDLKEGINRFSNKLVDMVSDIWKKLVDLIPGLGKAREVVGSAVDTTKQYAQKGVDTVRSAGTAVSDFVKGTFGGGATPKGATATATAGAPPAQTAVASAAPTGGGAPAQTTAPAPAARDGSGVERTANNVPAPAGNNKGGGGAIDDAATKAMIVKHEGIREKPYQDSLGLWTVGIGHLIGDGKKLPDDWNRKFSMDEIMTLFDKDYETHKAAAASIIPNFDKMTGSMKSAFIDLTYNMGPNWISKWPNLKKQLGTFDIAAAVDNLTNSKWATQVGNRAGDIIGMLKSALPAEKGGVFDGPKSGYPMTLHGPEAVIPLKDGAVPVSMSQEFNMTATNLGELVSEMRNNMAMQDRMISVLEEIRRAQTTVADNTGRMVSYANN